MNKRGFTLIELLIAIAIISILVGIAYPSYTQHLLKSKRSEAQSTLIEIANSQEMFYLDNHQYAVNLNTELGLSANPFITENGYYSIATSSADATLGFTLTATAISTQTQDTDCTKLTVTQDLSKTAIDSDGNSSAICW